MSKLLKNLTILTITVLTLGVISKNVRADTTNLVANPSFEAASPTNTNLPEAWYTSSYGKNKPVFTYPAIGKDGGKAIQVQLTSRSSGDAKWYFKEIIAKPGDTYTISEVYKSNIKSKLTMQYQKEGSSTYYYFWIADVPSSSTTWKTFSKDFIMPAGVKNFTIFFLVSSAGTLTIDEVSLIDKTASTPPVIPPDTSPPVIPVPTDPPIIPILTEPPVVPVPTTNPPTPVDLAKGIVSLDFDDGWSNQYTNAVPLLNAAGYKATFYIITDTFTDYDGYMTLPQVLQLKNQGHEIGCHTKTHPHLTTLSSTALANEVLGARQVLLSAGAGAINAFSYPYGEYNANVIQAVKSAGFSYARTVDTGYNTKLTDPYLLRVQNVYRGTSVATITGWIDKAVADKTWLILVFHEVRTDGDQYSILPSNLQGVINYLLLKNVTVVTASQGLVELAK